jgi:isopentenyl-diphosphate delta-isomerase
VENELCPVYVATVAEPLVANPDEVAELRWVPLDELRAAASAVPWALSPWLVAQLIELDHVGGWAESR